MPQALPALLAIRTFRFASGGGNIGSGILPPPYRQRRFALLYPSASLCLSHVVLVSACLCVSLLVGRRSRAQVQLPLDPVLSSGKGSGPPLGWRKGSPFDTPPERATMSPHETLKRCVCQHDVPIPPCRVGLRSGRVQGSHGELARRGYVVRASRLFRFRRRLVRGRFDAFVPEGSARERPTYAMGCRLWFWHCCVRSCVWRPAS